MLNSKTIAHFRNGVGNFVTLTPALQALASMDESGTIDICTDALWFDSRKVPLLDFWGRMPFIGRVYSFEEVRASNSYKIWFWTSWNSCGESLEWFMSKAPYDAGYWDMVNLHESEYYMSIVRRFYGYKGATPKQLVVPADEPLLDSEKVNIVLCNGGFGEYCMMKKWPHFGALARELKNLFGDSVCVIKVGYKNELEEVVNCDLNFVNKLSITQTTAVIKQATLLICDDTGNMHIGDALRTPMLVLWGGSILGKNRPINGAAKILSLDLPCQPCQNNSGYLRCENLSCVNDLGVGEVMYNVRQFIKNGGFNGNDT